MDLGKGKGIDLIYCKVCNLKNGSLRISSLREFKGCTLLLPDPFRNNETLTALGGRMTIRRTLPVLYDLIGL